ncbi:MAG: hypothetical protein L6V91_09035 [Bacilli bacterium]|nr:MAG: hypothetical protein L6V91_09035 [Bacilli bacterium]
MKRLEIRMLKSTKKKSQSEKNVRSRDKETNPKTKKSLIRKKFLLFYWALLLLVSLP